MCGQGASVAMESELGCMDSIALAATAETGLALARQPWAAQVGLVFEAAGIPSDLADGTLGMPELTAALLARHIDSYAAASVKVQRYIESVRGGSVTAQTYRPASYKTAVPVRRHRRRLAQWRTGSHWLAEETGRWQGLLREQRPCPHCQHPLEDVRHVVYDCPLYAELRQDFGDLFPSTGIMPGLAEFLCQDSQGRLAKFADRCFDAHAAALAQ